MSLSADLKVVNTATALRLQESLVDCDRIDFYQSCDAVINVVGTDDRRLVIAPVTQPENTQVVLFEETIADIQYDATNIHVLLEDGTIQSVLKSERDQMWKSTQRYCHRLRRDSESVAGFCLSADGIVVCTLTNDGRTLTVDHLSTSTSLWRTVAVLDCLDGRGRRCCLWPSSDQDRPVVLIGTGDGHLYRVSLEDSQLKLICDVRQSLVSVHGSLNSQLLVVGAQGKVVALQAKGGAVRTGFMPGSVWRTSLVGQQLYVQDGDRLMSMDVQTEAAGGEASTPLLGPARDCRVRFVRAFNAGTKSVTVLTETGYVYQVVPPLEEAPLEAASDCGQQVASLLRRIRTSADRTKEFQQQAHVVHQRLGQVSTALQLLAAGPKQVQFAVQVRSFPDVRDRRGESVHISVTNPTDWYLSASNWSLCVSCGGSSSDRAVDWRPGETLELVQPLQLTDGAYHLRIRVGLVFHSPASCVRPLADLRLGVLHLLRPAVSTDVEAVSTATVSTALGIRRSGTLTRPLWPLLLHSSWHRGFDRLRTPAESAALLLCCCVDTPVRFSQSEQRDDLGAHVTVVRVETTDRRLLQALRLELAADLLGQSTASGEIRVPGSVHARLQSLRNRMNYVLKLSRWDSSDLQPLMDETDSLLAKHMPVIIG